MGVISFDDFSKGIDSNESKPHKFKQIKESKSIKKIKTVKKPSKKVNESSFQVGDDYKVKVTIDVPVSLIEEYVQKVETETGKNALTNFTETELAEQMVNYVVKQNMTLDQLPSALSIGEEEAGEISSEIADADADDLSNELGDEVETDSDTIESEEGEDLDLESEDDDESETDKTTEEDLDFEGEEIELEGEEIELEADDETTEDSEEDVEEEEESGIEDLYKRVGYNKYLNNTKNPYYSTKKW